MGERYKESLVVFDADFLLYFATMGNKVFDSEGVPIKENGRFVYTEKTVKEVQECADSIILNMLKVVNASKYVGYLGNVECFRYDIYPEYKANRKDSPKPSHFKELKAYLRDRWGFILLDIPIEADDAVNIIKNRLKEEYHIFIVTSDKDLMKCIEGYYINPKNCELVNTEAEEAEYNFWTSMITGDTVDNIKGIPGAGVAFAKKLFAKNIWQNLWGKVQYRLAVETSYYEKFGKDDYLKEFNKNYSLLYILEEYDDLPTPEIQYVKQEDMDEFGERGASTTSSESGGREELW